MNHFKTLIGIGALAIAVVGFAAQPTCPIECQNAIDPALNQAVKLGSTCNIGHQPFGVVILETSDGGFGADLGGGGKAVLNRPCGGLSITDIADAQACATYFMGQCRSLALDIVVN